MSRPRGPEFFRGLFDDAAVFPPGDLPLLDAVHAHRRHRRGSYADVVGALVVAAAHLPELHVITDDLPERSLDLSVTVPTPADAADTVRATDRIPAVRLVGLEVALPADLPARRLVPMLDAGLTHRQHLTVFVEVPRDQRRDAVVAALTASPYLAKLRTGGVSAEQYPGTDELAAAVESLVRVGLRFKATAGLHHALRNTDPHSGFEQHGILNVLSAVAAAMSGSSNDAVATALAERDPEVVLARLRDVRIDVRSAFVSIGTCSIVDPVTELVALGLLPGAYLTGVVEPVVAEVRT